MASPSSGLRSVSAGDKAGEKLTVSPRTPSAGTPSPAPDAIEEEVYNIARPSGYILEGRMVLPPRSASASIEGGGGDTSRYVCVMCHGVLSHRDHNFAQALSHRLASATAARVLRFDFRFEPSDLEPAFRYRFSGFEDDLDDLTHVLAKLRADGYRPWMLLGHSRGGNDVLMFAGRRPELVWPGADGRPAFAVAALSARFYMPNMFTRLFSPETVASVDAGETCEWATKRGLLSVTPDDAAVVRERMDMGRDTQAIPAGVPVLMVHGRDDDVIPVDDAAKFKQVREELIFHVIEGAKHAFSGRKQQRELLDTVSQWAAGQIRSLACR